MWRRGLRPVRRLKLTSGDGRERTMLIKELQDLQHRCGYLPREALQELAERLKVPFFEVYGVASFYPHFRFEPPTGTEIRICTDLSCHLAGASALKAALHAGGERLGLAGAVSIGETSCLGRCDAPVAYSVDEQVYRGGSPAAVPSLIQSLQAGQLPPRQPLRQVPDRLHIDPYGEVRPFEALRQLVGRRHFTGWQVCLDNQP
jgi:NADH:ubiquinone oxidoreductase subunit E